MSPHDFLMLQTSVTVPGRVSAKDTKLVHWSLNPTLDSNMYAALKALGVDLAVLGMGRTMVIKIDQESVTLTVGIDDGPVLGRLKWVPKPKELLPNQTGFVLQYVTPIVAAGVMALRPAVLSDCIGEVQRNSEGGGHASNADHKAGWYRSPILGEPVHPCFVNGRLVSPADPDADKPERRMNMYLGATGVLIRPVDTLGGKILVWVGLTRTKRAFVLHRKSWSVPRVGFEILLPEEEQTFLPMGTQLTTDDAVLVVATQAVHMEATSDHSTVVTGRGSHIGCLKPLGELVTCDTLVGQLLLQLAGLKTSLKCTTWGPGSLVLTSMYSRAQGQTSVFKKVIEHGGNGRLDVKNYRDGVYMTMEAHSLLAKAVDKNIADKSARVPLVVGGAAAQPPAPAPDGDVDASDILGDLDLADMDAAPHHEELVAQAQAPTGRDPAADQAERDAAAAAEAKAAAEAAERKAQAERDAAAAAAQAAAEEEEEYRRLANDLMLDVEAQGRAAAATAQAAAEQAERDAAAAEAKAAAEAAERKAQAERNAAAAAAQAAAEEAERQAQAEKAKRDAAAAAEAQAAAEQERQADTFSNLGPVVNLGVLNPEEDPDYTYVESMDEDWAPSRRRAAAAAPDGGGKRRAVGLPAAAQRSSRRLAEKNPRRSARQKALQEEGRKNKMQAHPRLLQPPSGG